MIFDGVGYDDVNGQRSRANAVRRQMCVALIRRAAVL